MTKNDSALFYTCSLIEYIGRQQQLPRNEVVIALGKENLQRIYRYADVLHCEPIARVADEYITMAKIPKGNFDNVGTCRYTAPDYWTIGEVYSRLIADLPSDDCVTAIMETYQSWISDKISNYNTDFYYQPRDYIKECFLANEVLE